MSTISAVDDGVDVDGDEDDDDDDDDGSDDGFVAEAATRQAAEPCITAPIRSSATAEVGRRLLSDLAVLVTRHCASVDLQVLLPHPASAHCLHSRQETWYDCPRQLTPGTANFTPHPIAGCCHLVNLMTLFHSRCPDLCLKVSRWHLCGEIVIPDQYLALSHVVNAASIVCSDKSVAYVTNNKILCFTFCAIDRHEALHGIFATAQHLLMTPSVWA